MSSWWSWLPSLRPVRGLARFLYIWTHWDTISEDLKKRDERPQAVEGFGRLLLQLQQEAHEAKRAKLERQMRELHDESEKWREAANSMAKTRTELIPLIDFVAVRFREIQQQSAAMQEDFMNAVLALTVMLYYYEDKDRERMLQLVSPLVRAMVTKTFEQVRALEMRGGGDVTPPPLAP